MVLHAQMRYIALFLLGGILGHVGGCTERKIPEDEITEVCEQACPIQFECGFAPEGKTLDDCLEGCPANLKTIRDACRADFKLFACLSTLSCQEYFEYTEALDRKFGTFGDPPPFPCQAEVIASARECQGVEGI